MSDTVEFWQGQFGSDYVNRQTEVDWRARIPFWRAIIEETEATRFLEVGCGVGHNLKAIREVLPDTGIMSGVDVNKKALVQAGSDGFDVEECAAAEINTIWEPGSAEMVFTAGVLIHVAPDDLPGVMRAIVEQSARWVLAVEYADDAEVEVEYRGNAGKLWRRPFGKLYEAMGLSLVQTGVAEGFDNCTYWLLEKSQ